MKQIPLLVALAFALPASCQACATVTYESGLPPEIDVTDESALIVWDAKTQTEHFVREANFRTQAKNFGFLVPTPTLPQLGTAQEGLFGALERELMPRTKTIVQRGINWTPLLASGAGKDEGISDVAANTAAGEEEDVNSVEVVEQKRVGAYNASVLRANDTAALTKWLREHHYAVTADTRRWLEPYIKAGFFLTAFQIASDKSAGGAHAKAVRLSFKTPVPFYPYREPGRAQKQGGGRSLRLFYAGEKRMQGSIDNGSRSAAWPADTEYSATLDSQKLREQGLPVSNNPLRLTAFVDWSSPRPGWGDLRFYESSDQKEKTPPPFIVHQDGRLWLPTDVLVFVAIMAVWIGRAAVLHKRDSI